MYRVEIASRRVEKQLDKVHDDFYPRVAEVIEALKNNPRPVGAKKLGGKVHRIRVGPYRVLYEILDDRLVVLVVEIGDRREIYR